MSLFEDDLAALPTLSETFRRWCVDFQLALPERPVACLDLAEPPATALPEQGGGAAGAFTAFARDIAPGLSASAGPRYLGFVTGGTTPAAMLADWLVAAIDQNLSSPGDSIASGVELQVLAWLRQLFGLPDAFTGVLTSGATAANLLGMVCGRQFAGLQLGRDIARDGFGPSEIEVFSATPHASTLKALSLAGLGRERVTQVACLSNSEAMDVAALEAALRARPSVGKIVVASAGTVTGNDYDDLVAIARLCRAHNAWLHVDGAFGLFARLSESRRTWLDGVDLADSITCDAHKWLNVPYDCGMFFTRHPSLLQQVCSVTASYLDVGEGLPSFLERGIENSRRFRALPLWMSLQAYGRTGIAELVENNCRQAAQLADWIVQSDGYELLTPCKLNVVVFRPKGEEGSARDVLRRINRSGKVFMTPGQWQGQAAIRAAFSNWSTTSEDVRLVCGVLAASTQAPPAS